MEFQIDENGQEVLLKEGKFQVMMEWERPYMHACIDALKPFGAVLEIGFGLGYSATRIQAYHPQSHTIVEYDPEVAERARQWAKAYPNVTIVEDTWQQALGTLGVFDAIFFDDYPLYSEAEMLEMEEEVKTSQPLLAQGKNLLAEVHAAYPTLHTLRYTDADLTELLREVPLTETLQLARFLKELKESGQITEAQLLRQMQTFVDEQKIRREEAENLLVPSPKAPPQKSDRLFYFLKECLEKHMRKGSRFSCFLSDPTSKYEDEKFCNAFLSDPFIEYHEEWIPITVPSNCNYYHSDTALVITLIKL